MLEETRTLTIGAVASAANVTVETIRFYQRRGLLAVPRRPYGQVRRYGAADVARVTFVKGAQRLGFSLSEVKTLLKLDDGAHCAEARVLAETKLRDVRARLRDLRRMAATLSALVARCEDARGRVSCPIIAALRPGRPDAR